MTLQGGKRKANKSLKAWVSFVKKVQSEEKLSYKDAIHRAKQRKDKGEKWMTGGQTPSTEMVTIPVTVADTQGMATATGTQGLATAALVDEENAMVNGDNALLTSNLDNEMGDNLEAAGESIEAVADNMAEAVETSGGKKKRKTMRRSKGRGKARSTRKARGRSRSSRKN